MLKKLLDNWYYDFQYSGVFDFCYIEDRELSKIDQQALIKEYGFDFTCTKLLDYYKYMVNLHENGGTDGF